jgi:adenylate isopentenyltransferase (cytokinin synthase)
MLSIKPVVILGATGTGKTKLSIDVCKAIGGEVVNTDKMQIYAGLNIATNKVNLNDQHGIPHHLIGMVSAISDDLSVPWFRSIATTTSMSIARRGRVPVLVGGSNSLIHGFLAEQFDPSIGDPFALARYRPNLRFKSCLLWLHADELVLNEYLNCRIDDMVQHGLVEEIKEYYDTMSIGKIDGHNGLARAIGVRELKDYFSGHRGLSTCIDEMKVNTQALARAQTRKICRIAGVWGWPVRALDATEAMRARLNGSSQIVEDIIWEHYVSLPAITTINDFLHI